MKKTFFTMAVMLFMAAGMQAQLLWKISGNGLERPSYVIGTYHLASVSFIDEIAGVKEALTETDQVYGELNMDVLANADSLALMQQAMTLPEGKTYTVSVDEQQKAERRAVLDINGSCTVRDVLGELNSEVDIVSFHRLIPRMNDIFIKLVGGNDKKEEEQK